jgi:hypothetical protein
MQCAIFCQPRAGMTDPPCGGHASQVALTNLVGRCLPATSVNILRCPAHSVAYRVLWCGVEEYCARLREDHRKGIRLS